MNHKKLKSLLPDLDFMGRIWTENLEKKTFHKPFIRPKSVEKWEESKESPETFIEEEDEFDDIDEFKEHNKTPIKNLNAFNTCQGW